jgi:hypothetical protein
MKGVLSLLRRRKRVRTTDCADEETAREARKAEKRQKRSKQGTDNSAALTSERSK